MQNASTCIYKQANSKRKVICVIVGCDGLGHIIHQVFPVIVLLDRNIPNCGDNLGALDRVRDNRVLPNDDLLSVAGLHVAQEAAEALVLGDPPELRHHDVLGVHCLHIWIKKRISKKNIK